nr:hypothetical protein [Tanacetum cinerariifolium]
MTPKRTTRANPATTTTTTTTSITDAQLEAPIEQGVARALAARDADRNTNGDDSHNSGTGARRTERVTRECTYPDFMKCKPLNFKGTKGVVGLKEIDKVKKYVDGLPDTIYGSVMVTKPKTMQDAIEFTTKLKNKKINTWAERNGERKEYVGTLPLCNRCKFHHNGQCTINQEVEKSSAVSAARQNEPAIAMDDPYSLVREELYGFVDRVDVAPERPMELGYGITDTWDELVGDNEEITPTTLQGVNQRVTDLSIIVEQETTIMYGMMEEAQDDRSQLRGRVNLLYRDRHVHRHLAVMIEREARMAREAWGLSMDASDNVRSDVMSLRTMLVAQHTLILDLHASYRRTQGVIKELLAADHKRQV